MSLDFSGINPRPQQQQSTVNSSLDFSGITPRQESNDQSASQQSSVTSNQSNTNNQPSILSKLANLADTISIGGFNGDRLLAAGLGAFHAVDSVATTALKAGAKTGILPLDPAAIQSTYNSNTADYNQIAQQHPLYANLGQLAGSALMTAPLMYAPSTIAGAGIGSLGALGKLALNGASMTAQGGLIGGLTTQQGQDPNSIINQQGAKTGAEVGGLLGTTIAPMAASWLDGTANLAAAQTMAPGVKIFESDLPKDGSWVQGAKQWVTNSILNNTPGVFGTQGARVTQSNQIQQAIAKYLSDVSQDAINKGPVAIGNILDNHAAELKNTYNNLWDTFRNNVPSTPVPLTNANDGIQQLKSLVTDSDGNLLKASDTGLSNTQANIINNLPTDSASPQQIINAKQQLWDIYDKSQKTINRGGSVSPNLSDIAQQAKSTYWNMLDDMKGGLQSIEGDSSPALQAFNDANNYTIGYKNLFDPQTRPQLINAIKDGTDQGGKVNDFIRWINSSSTSNAEIKPVANVLGQTGQSAINQLKMQQLYNSSMDNVGGKQAFNLNTFLDGLTGIENSPQKDLYQPAIDALQGLRQVGQQWAQSQAPQADNTFTGLTQKYAPLVAGASLAAPVISHAAAGTSLTNPITAGITITPFIMSKIMSNSPLKNALIGLSKVTDLAPSSVTQFLQNKATNILNKAGAMMSVDPTSGKAVIDKQPVTPSGQKVSLNEYSPLIPQGQPPSPKAITPPVQAQSPYPVNPTNLA